MSNNSLVTGWPGAPAAVAFRLDGTAMHRAVEITRLFAIELEKGARIFKHLVACFHLAQKLRHLGLDATVAGNINLPARFDADHTNVLDRRLGTVTRAA